MVTETRSVGVSPAVTEASRSRRRAGRMPTPQRARRPRYQKNSSLYFAIHTKSRLRPAQMLRSDTIF
jgi:hypothetical protein